MEMIQEISWLNALSEEMEKPYFKDLMLFIQSEYVSSPNGIFPSPDVIFRAIDLCPLSDVQVVILGQDPYPTKGHAHGLCFSVEEDVRPFPKSLNNIFKEIENDLGLPHPENGSLMRWAKQGVLLLNSVLTVREGQPESHARKGWEEFTDAVIKRISQERQHVVYMLWGSKAQEKAKMLDENTNLILRAPHPSPLSSYRGFFGCKHFSQTNTYLIGKGKKGIEW
jgi:uracil-DNA glycosylase